MVYLDCETYESALGSLAAGAGVTEQALLQAIDATDLDPAPSDEDVWVAVPRQICTAAGFNIEAVRFPGAYYFHGTRVVDPMAFKRDGILPLSAMVDRLWEMLFSLVKDQVSAVEWRQLRKQLDSGESNDDHSSWLYRMKTGDPAHYGPYASLVRDHVRYPIPGEHNYLASPEIVEDIARSVGLGLQHRFEAASSPCIVKFRSQDIAHRVAATEAALWYVSSRTKGIELGPSSVYGHSCDGRPVPVDDVVGVEVCTL